MSGSDVLGFVISAVVIGGFVLFAVSFFLKKDPRQVLSNFIDYIKDQLKGDTHGRK